MATTVHCPKCGCEVEVTALIRQQVEADVRASVAAQLEGQVAAATSAAEARVREMGEELADTRAKLASAADQAADFMKQRRALEEREQQLALDVERRIDEETKRIREQEAKAAQERCSREAGVRIRAMDEELADTRAKLAAAADQAADFMKQRRALEEREQQLALDVERRVDEETRRIREQEARAAQERCSREADVRVRAIDEELADTRAKLAAAADQAADFMKQRRALEEREQQLALDVERRVDEETRRVREQEAKLAEDRAALERGAHELREAEHQQTIDGLKKHVAELQRRVQQGSQQAQGEVQELMLRDVLLDAFPTDCVEDIPKGVAGADVIHRVRAHGGRDCGSIVWESKRTKAWSDEWLRKVRDDQREAGAALAVIVTQVLPSDVRHFGPKDDVWVCSPAYAAALGAVLRGGLVEVALAKRVAEGRGEKMQMLFDYLTGTEFRNRFGGFVEAFKEMQDDLEKERRAMQTAWKRREKVLRRARDNITAFYGDLQGIAGRQLQDLPTLALEPPPAATADEDDGDDTSPPTPRPARAPGKAVAKAVVAGSAPE